MSRGLLLCLVIWLINVVAHAAVPAFPGAQGFGAAATGGRGGRVVIVTNLNANGPGSLQAALDSPGPRIVVFRVSGVINVEEIFIEHGDLTIAGQTAPGGGITIAGRVTARYSTDVSNIIVRHIRIRPPLFANQTPGEQYDALQLSRVRNVILDHISVSHGVDETIDLYEARDVTVQYSTIGTSQTQGHPEGAHNYGLINGPDGGRISLHHNLFANHNARTPALAQGPAETTNNLIYNVKDAWVHHNPAGGAFIIEGTHFIRGPSTSLTAIFLDAEAIGPGLAYYIRGNFIDNPGRFVGELTDPINSIDYMCDYHVGNCSDYFVTSRPQMPTPYSVETQSVQSTFDLVLEKSGAFPPDIITRQIKSDVVEGTGTWGAEPPSNLMDGLTPTDAPNDTDGDGIPDTWEVAHDLNPRDASDYLTVINGGEYTAIEVYINSLAGDLIVQSSASIPKPPVVVDSNRE